MPTEVEFPDGVEAIRAPEQKIFDGQPFPLILAPSSSFRDRDPAFWQQWVKTNINALKELLLKYGAILFRQFPLNEPAHFDLFAKAFGWAEFPYVGGVSVRKPIVGNVFTTTESPPDRLIPYHHEMAHVTDHPKFLFFHCDVPAPEGGETPIALSHVIYERMAQLEPEFVKRLAAEGLRYVRIVPEENDFSSALGRGWKSTFFAESKEDAEVKAKKAGFDIEWLPGNNLKTVTEVLPAIRTNKRTGKTIWFNSVLNVYVAWQDDRNDRKKAVIFPNGDTLQESWVDSLTKVTEEVGVSFRWEKADTILIDNMQVLHSRNHFTPPRVILASLFKDE